MRIEDGGWKALDSGRRTEGWKAEDRGRRTEVEGRRMGTGDEGRIISTDGGRYIPL